MKFILLSVSIVAFTFFMGVLGGGLKKVEPEMIVLGAFGMSFSSASLTLATLIFIFRR